MASLQDSAQEADEERLHAYLMHSRHRNPINFLVNLVAGLIAYCHQPKKPSLGLQLLALPEA